MLIFKNFTYSQGSFKGNPAAIFTDEDGNDWYQSQKKFKADSLKVAFDKSGLVVVASFDASTLAPANLSVAEIETKEIPQDFFVKSKRWQFNGYGIVTCPYTTEEVQQKAESQRQNLLTVANSITADWRTELQLETITDDDKASLIKWMAYIKAVKTIDLKGITNEEALNEIVWPVQPESE